MTKPKITYVLARDCPKCEMHKRLSHARHAALIGLWGMLAALILVLLAVPAHAINCTNLTLQPDYNETIFCDEINATIRMPQYPYLGEAVYFHWADYGVAPLLNYSNPSLGLYVYNTPAANCVNQTIVQNNTVFVNQTINQTVFVDRNVTQIQNVTVEVPGNCTNATVYVDRNVTVYSNSTLPAWLRTEEMNCSKLGVTYDPAGNRWNVCFDNITGIREMCDDAAIASGNWFGCIEKYSTLAKNRLAAYEATTKDLNLQLELANAKVTGLTVGGQTASTIMEQGWWVLMILLVGLAYYRYSKRQAVAPAGLPAKHPGAAYIEKRKRTIVGD